NLPLIQFNLSIDTSAGSQLQRLRVCLVAFTAFTSVQRYHGSTDSVRFACPVCTCHLELNKGDPSPSGNIEQLTTSATPLNPLMRVDDDQDSRGKDRQNSTYSRVEIATKK